MEKIVKSRKDYTCEACGGNIKKGELSLSGSVRIPKYDKDDNQIGIEYIKWRCHSSHELCIPEN